MSMFILAKDKDSGNIWNSSLFCDFDMAADKITIAQ